MTPFQRLERHASRAVDQFHGETTTIRPQNGSAYLSGDSSSRPVRRVRGVVDIVPQTNAVRARNIYVGELAAVRSDKVHISYNVSEFRSQDDWPQQGDHIELNKREGSPSVAVSSAEPDGMGRILVKCVWVPA